MAITYGDYTFLVPDGNHELSEWLEDHADFDRLNLFAWAGPPARPAQVWLPPRLPRGILPTIQRPNWPEPPRLQINQLYVPTGASRWSVGLFLCDGEAAAKLPESGTLTLEDGTATVAKQGTPAAYKARAGSVSYPMFRLAVLPIGRAAKASSQVHLVVLVDKRYYRQSFHDVVGVDETSTDTKWKDFIDDLDPLELEISEKAFSEVDGDDGFRPSPEWDGRPDARPVILDAACESVGLRIVPKQGSTDAKSQAYAKATGEGNALYAAETAAEALKALKANVKAAAHIHGGPESAVVPAHVDVVFPVYRNTYGSDDLTYTVSVSRKDAAAQDTGVKTSQGDTILSPWLIRCGAFADCQDPTCPEDEPIFEGDSESVRNDARLKKIAKLLAKNYYDWQSGGYTYTFSGISAWEPCGYDDCLIYQCGSQGPRRHEAVNNEQKLNPAGYRMQTIVRSLPANHGLADVPAYIDRRIVAASTQNTGQPSDYKPQDDAAVWLLQHEYWAVADGKIEVYETGLVKIRTYTKVRIGYDIFSAIPRLDGDKVLVRYFSDNEGWRIVGGPAPVHLFETTGPFVFPSGTDDHPVYCNAKQLSYYQPAKEFPEGEEGEEAEPINVPGDYETTGDDTTIYWSQCPRNSKGYLKAVAGIAGLRFACIWQVGTGDIGAIDKDSIQKTSGRWEIIDGWDMTCFARLTGAWDYSSGTPTATARFLYYDGSDYTASQATITIDNPSAPKDESGNYRGTPKGAAGEVYAITRTHDNRYAVIGGSGGSDLVIFKLTSSWAGTGRPLSATAVVQQYNDESYVSTEQTITVYWCGGCYRNDVASGFPAGTKAGAWGSARFNSGAGIWEVVAIFDAQHNYVGLLNSDWECSGSNNGTSASVKIVSGGRVVDVSAIGFGFAKNAKLRNGAQVVVSFLPDDGVFVFIGIPREGDAGDGGDDSDQNQLAAHLQLYRSTSAWNWSGHGTTTAPTCTAVKVVASPDDPNDPITLTWPGATRHTNGNYVQSCTGREGMLLWASDVSGGQWKVIDFNRWTGLVQLTSAWDHTKDPPTASAHFYYDGTASDDHITVTMPWKVGDIPLPRGKDGEIYAASETSDGTYETHPQKISAVCKITSAWSYTLIGADEATYSCKADIELYYLSTDAVPDKYVSTSRTVTGHYRGGALNSDGSFTGSPAGAAGKHQWGVAEYDPATSLWQIVSLFNPQTVFRATIHNADPAKSWTKADVTAKLKLPDSGAIIDATPWGYPTGATLQYGTEVLCMFFASECKFYFGFTFHGVYAATTSGGSLSSGGSVACLLTGANPAVTVTAHDALLKSGETIDAGTKVVISYTPLGNKFLVIAASCP